MSIIEDRKETSIKKNIKVVTANEAVALAVKYAKVDVVGAYPISPQTSIMEYLTKYQETEKLDLEIVRVESEHSAMAVAMGAAAVGSRAFTATASQGLLYMAEMVYWVAGSRLPVVMVITSRAMGAPWVLGNEHTDMLLPREWGWMVLVPEHNQEVFDTIIQAYKLADSTFIPVIVGLDGYILSHTTMPIELPSQELVDAFIPKNSPKPYALDTKDPSTHGNAVYQQLYQEMRWDIFKTIEESQDLVDEINKAWAKLTGRDYGGVIEEYMLDDAEVAIVIMGASSGDAKETAKLVREKYNIKAGVIRLRSVRPFPIKRLYKIFNNYNIKAIGVIDRNMSPGLGGMIATEIKFTLYDLPKRPKIQSYIGGLGGRDIKIKDFENIFLELKDIADNKKDVQLCKWINLDLESYNKFAIEI
ncbi:MAG: pyruvate ferredoxin oxidoreductase [bacterium]|nr:pyruvate ferredoxin oxidoreductase [bacterium]